MVQISAVHNFIEFGVDYFPAVLLELKRELFLLLCRMVDVRAMEMLN